MVCGPLIEVVSEPEIATIIEKILIENLKQVAEYKGGKKQLLGFLLAK